MTKKVILPRGLQASGKTTWAKQFIKDNPDYIRLSRDDFRHMLDGYTYSKATEKIVTDMMQTCIITAIKTGKNLILDETNLNKKFLDEKIDMFIRNGYEIEIKDFPITIGEALTRDAARQFPIGASVIKRTWRNYEIELKEMIDRNKPKLLPVSGLPSCIIVDIDGTLANSVHRKIFDETAYGTDMVILPVRTVLRSLKRETGYTILLFSGREDKGVAKENTERWLFDNNVPYDELFMRKEGDHRNDTIVKREMFEEHVREKYNAMFVIDDRPSVVQMWVDLGLFVFNVNQDPMCKNPF
ncbi:MAG TPA: AAA family ATPase [Clostridia bacterium]|nr:AAA family ATPase [Clostridia bacterium]